MAYWNAMTSCYEKNGMYEQLSIVVISAMTTCTSLSVVMMGSVLKLIEQFCS
jgi:hypothetical protein